MRLDCRVNCPGRGLNVSECGMQSRCVRGLPEQHFRAAIDGLAAISTERHPGDVPSFEFRIAAIRS